MEINMTTHEWVLSSIGDKEFLNQMDKFAGEFKNKYNIPIPIRVLSLHMIADILLDKPRDVDPDKMLCFLRSFVLRKTRDWYRKEYKSCVIGRKNIFLTEEDIHPLNKATIDTVDFQQALKIFKDQELPSMEAKFFCLLYLCEVHYSELGIPYPKVRHIINKLNRRLKRNGQYETLKKLLSGDKVL